MTDIPNNTDTTAISNTSDNLEPKRTLKELDEIKELDKNQFYNPKINVYRLSSRFSNIERVHFEKELNEIIMLAIGISTATKENDVSGLNEFLNSYFKWYNNKYHYMIKVSPKDQLLSFYRIIKATSFIDNGMKNTLDDIALNKIGSSRLFVERNYFSKNNETEDLHLLKNNQNYEQQKEYLALLLSDEFFQTYYSKFFYNDPAKILYDAVQFKDEKGLNAMIYYASEMKLNAEDFIQQLSTEADYGRFNESLIEKHILLPPGETQRNVKQHFDDLKLNYIGENRVDDYIFNILNKNN